MQARFGVRSNGRLIKIDCETEKAGMNKGKEYQREKERRQDEGEREKEIWKGWSAAGRGT